MTEDHPSNTQLPLSLGEVVEDIRKLSREELFRWLAAVMDESSPESIPLPTTWPRHTSLAMLYRSCDLPLQLRFSDAFARLLESFEPPLRVAPSDRHYLFTLLSLAATVRNDRAKKRLCRWLYLELFRDWEEEFFNLHGELILATAAYDQDDAWVEYMSKVLPTRPFFGKVARQSFRALLQTKGTDCLKLLPNMLKVLDPEVKDNRDQFGYLLGLTVTRHGLGAFLKKAAEALNSAGLTVAEVVAAVSSLDKFLAAALRGSSEQVETSVRYLTSEVWQPVIQKWDDMSEEDNLNTFVEILEGCHQYTIIPQAAVKNVLGALTFGGSYELIVPTNFKHLAPFFKDYEVNYEEANRPRAAGAAAGGNGRQ